MKKVDLNVDIGEGFPNDEALLEFATSANVCCGEHAGSWELTQATFELCRSKGVRIGLHPGYPDRENMGRKSMQSHQWREYEDSLESQFSRCLSVVKASYVKPHGAFYNDTAVVLAPPGPDEEETRSSKGAEYIIAALTLASLPCGGNLLLMVGEIPCLLGLPGTAHEEFAFYNSAVFISEGFADRAYRPAGTLVPRSEPGAVLHDPEQIKRQVMDLGSRVDSICLHGDTPDCLQFAELVYKTLVDNGYEVGY